MGVVVVLLIGLGAVIWWSGWGRETPIGRVISNVVVALVSAAIGVIMLLPPSSAVESLIGLGALLYALYGAVLTVPLWRAAGKRETMARSEETSEAR